LTSPRHGGPAWIELTSPHFQLRTDLAYDNARRQINLYERMFDVFVQLTRDIFPGPPPTEKMQIVQFTREKDYEAVAPIETTQGRFVSAGFRYFPVTEPEAPPVVVLNGTFQDAETFTVPFDWIRTRVLRHELMHRFVRHYVHFSPWWLDEGLATFFEMVGTGHMGRTFVGGEPFWFIPSHMPSAAQLLAADVSTFQGEEAAPAVAGAWAMVTMLWEPTRQYHDQFVSFVRALAHREHVEKAFTEAFTDFSMQTFEGEYRAFLPVATRRSSAWAVGITPSLAPPITSRQLSDTELSLLWAELSQRSREEVAATLKAELGRDADSGEVHFFLGELFKFIPAMGWQPMPLDFPRAEHELTLAVARAPDVPRYRVALALLHAQAAAQSPDAAEKLAALSTEMRAAAKLARSPHELARVGRYYAWMGDREFATPFLMRAISVDPACWACFDTLALLASDGGDAAAAVVWQERALSVLPERSRALDGMKQRLEGYRRAATHPTARQ
jgi:hypothetical protein